MFESFSNIFKIPDLKKKILFTLGLIAVYRIGAFIPTPGIDSAKLVQFFENIAQTAAAMSGYKAKKSGSAAEIGFLGGVKNLRIYYLPDVDTNLITEVILENQVLNVNLIKGVIRQGDKLVAECEMKVFLID